MNLKFGKKVKILIKTRDKLEANKIYNTALEEIEKMQTNFPDNTKLITFSKIISDSQKSYNELDGAIK